MVGYAGKGCLLMIQLSRGSALSSRGTIRGL
jgi:hypothetical protein